VDILNEPENRGLFWAPTAGKPGLKDIYIATMDAVHRVSPNTLFFIEVGVKSREGAGLDRPEKVKPDQTVSVNCLAIGLLGV
jgi:hypothetical protein